MGPKPREGSDSSPLRRAANEQGDNRFKALFARGTAAHSIVDCLVPLNDELVLNKTTRSAFNPTASELPLRNTGIDGLVMCRVQTNAYVERTARDAADLGFKCAIADDACQCFPPVMCNATMMSFASLFGKVWDTARVLQWLEAGS